MRILTRNGRSRLAPWGLHHHEITIATILAMFIATVGLGASTFPDPAKDITAAAPATRQTAVLAGGCFGRGGGVRAPQWGDRRGVRLRRRKPVDGALPGGWNRHDRPRRIGANHLRSATVSYGKLLKVFFRCAHDPTELNRQGPDEGTQYRSSIFFANPEQKAVADAYITQLNAAHVFTKPVVTTVVALNGFYPAEADHQNFLARHPAIRTSWSTTCRSCARCRQSSRNC